jgi:hypothetical protein
MGRMSRMGLIGLIGLMLTSCAAPRVSLPAGVAAVMYAQARADYATAKVLVVQACAAGRWTPDACESARQIDQRAGVLRESIERALVAVEQPIDWAAVLEYTRAVSALLTVARMVP